MANGSKQRWFTTIPLAHRESPEWWTREAGALCLGLRALGMDSRFVLFGTPGPRADAIILARPADVEDSAWWKQQELTGVVLYSWGAPRYEPIARAIKQSGARLVLRMDTDGINSPRVWFWRYLSMSKHICQDERRALPAWRALVKTLIFHLFPSTFDDKFKSHLGHADLIFVESPLAEQRFKRFLARPEDAALRQKIVMAPPQISPQFSFDPLVVKKRQIIAVGRWDTQQKDAPMLVASLARVLTADPGCTAVIAGDARDGLQGLLSRLPAEIRARVSFLGHLGHEELLKHYRESRMIFFPSRFEGFPNSAVEALCCGCSVVGPAVIGSMNYCVTPACGTLACRRTPQDFADSLLAELSAWDRGERQPAQFSAWWQRTSWAPNVARRLLQICDQ
jgi:glycosyltransferase involved in cell wall biosynthesis